MALVKNKVLADAINKQYPNQTNILQLGFNTKRDLAGAGAGDTITLPAWANISDGMETMVKGTPLTPVQLDQTSMSVTVKHLG